MPRTGQRGGQEGSSLAGGASIGVPLDLLRNLSDLRVELLLDVVPLARHDLEDRVVELRPARTDVCKSASEREEQTRADSERAHEPRMSTCVRDRASCQSHLVETGVSDANARGPRSSGRLEGRTQVASAAARA